MTELFGRLAPGTDLDAARAELRAVHSADGQGAPRGVSRRSADFRIDAVRLRDQITSPARTVLLVLLAASALVFVIACSNVANLILARSVRREGELAIRAALGASAGALRRTLLAESLLLCGAGAVLGVLIARPMVAVLARYAARFSVRALDLTVDASLLWVGVGLAVAAAVLLAFVPRLPSADAANGIRSVERQRADHVGHEPAAAAVRRHADRRVVRAARRRRHAADDAVRAAATRTGFDTRNVLALNVPIVSYARKPQEIAGFYKEVDPPRESSCPASSASRSARPCRGATPGFFAAQFSVEGYAKANGEEDPRARFRTVSPGFFASLGVPIIAGRDFTDADRRDAEKVVIVSQSLAQRMFPNQDAVNRRLMWTDPVMKFIDVSPEPRRIVGVVADIDDENIVPGAGDDRLPPVRAGDRRRPSVRPRADRSVRAGPADHAHHPRAVGRSAGRAGGDARGRPRRSARAGSAERDGVRRVRRRRAADRGRRRGRRAGVLGERADARVRRPAGDRLGAAASADARSRRGRGHRRQRASLAGAIGGIAAGAGRRQLHPGRSHPGCAAARSARRWCWLPPRSSRR